jgi:hypothetical protein
VGLNQKRGVESIEFWRRVLLSFNYIKGRRNYSYHLNCGERPDYGQGRGIE